MTDRISRRQLLGAGAALGAASLLPASASAQGKQLVAATFPGTWNEAHRQYLAPAFPKKTGASVTQSILLGNDQLSRLTAARGGRPPFDVALFDRPQVLDAAKQGLIVEYPAAKSPNYKDVLPEFQDKWGPCISMQIIGIGYNPKKIKNPPKSWDALWDPQYKGRVGLTALNSQLGIAFLAEINRLRGGTEENFEPAFKALKGKDVPVELAVPSTGLVGWTTSMHVVANAAEPDLAVQYIDTHLDPAVQSAMLKPPYDVIPTNSKVKLEGAITTSIAKSHADLAKIRSFDWEKLNPQRGALIERFNREIKL